MVICTDDTRYTTQRIINKPPLLKIRIQSSHQLPYIKGGHHRAFLGLAPLENVVNKNRRGIPISSERRSSISAATCPCSMSSWYLPFVPCVHIMQDQKCVEITDGEGVILPRTRSFYSIRSLLTRWSSNEHHNTNGNKRATRATRESSLRCIRGQQIKTLTFTDA